MQAPESIEMSVRGETPFDTVVDRPIAEVNIVKEMLENKSAQVFRLDSKVQPSMYNKPLTLDHRLQAPDQLEMEHLYVNDVVSCDPYKCICEQDMESACMINEKYDFEKMKRAYFMEGCHLTAPPQNQMEGSHMAAQNAAGQRRDVSTVPVEELRPIGALCCVMDSLYCSFPGCIGCAGKYKFLCCMSKFSCCKCLPNPSEDEDRRCCAIQEQQRYLIIPQSCCEIQMHICCVDRRGALPCTPQVPCIVNLYGFTCCSDWKCTPGCCKTVGELIPRLKPESD